MDKYEYNLKLEEITRMVEKGNYEDAATIADSIDWRRVRNIRTLCMISEVYEVNERYEDSKDILMKAYKRSQTGRTILFRLAEISIKMKDFDEAVEYYSQFVNAAPNDNSRYVLKYKIFRGRGSAIEDQIAILEEYNQKEYTEKYGYELAKLYYKAGDMKKCVAACDDLVLWYRQGSYVIKALELKKGITDLTPMQQSIYDNRDKVIPTKAEVIEATVPELEKVILENLPDTEQEVLTEGIISETEKELAQVITEHTEAAQNDSGSGIDGDWGFAKKEEAVSPLHAPTKAMPDLNKIGNVEIQEPQKDYGFNTADLQAELAKNMHDIVSGIARKPSDEDIIEPMNDLVEEEPAVQEDDDNIEGQMSIDDILVSMSGAVQETAAAKEAVEEEKPAESVQEPVQPEAVGSEDTELKNTGMKTIESENTETEKEETAEQTESKVQEPEEEQPKIVSEKALALQRIAEEAAAAQKAAEEAAAAAAAAQKAAAEKRLAAQKAAEEAAREAAALTEPVAEVKETETKEAADETVTEEPASEQEKEPAPEKTRDMAAEMAKEPAPEPEVIPTKLTEDQQQLFSYFATVGGLREQIAGSIYHVMKKMGSMDKTSRNGNLVILGAEGSGKSTLGVHFAQCISKEKGEETAKIAKIYAEDFNKKDIPSTIAKISGGTLIIEEAGDLTDEVIEQLSKAMEFRTESLLVILEDEKKYLKELFEKHPELDEKFTTQIVIPVFTNDELVGFGRRYAEDEDYVIEEAALDALYERIGEVQGSGHPATVIDVKEIIDQAIKKSERVGFRKLGMILSKKRYDEEDRIILHEKDFK